ncbi:hypothetical protein PRZ48_011440 [Zasmidium cellare]|uniref:Uncharacterized protein n=1 Tax=Zasmidium cellare TaxID=395010 RepID=A0ABR0E6Z9_ZASCE|nr:hypothetical protein PRZ48_011440 [Zasmidium cellare]
MAVTGPHYHYERSTNAHEKSVGYSLLANDTGRRTVTPPNLAEGCIDMTLRTPDKVDPGEFQSLGPDIATTRSWVSTSGYLVTPRPSMQGVSMNPTSRQLASAGRRDKATYVDSVIGDGAYVYKWEDCVAELPRIGGLAVIPLAIVSCLHFIAEKESFKNLELHDRAAIRGALRWQLNEVDSHLFRQGQHSDCVESLHRRLRARRQLATDAAARDAAAKDAKDAKDAAAKDAAAECQYHKLFPLAPTVSRTEEADKLILEVWDPDIEFQDVLIFRGVVMAAFLSTVADLSSVLGSEIGSHVVQIL